MKNLSNKQLITIKKCIALGCAVICLLLMLFKGIEYTSSSKLSSGSDPISWSDTISLYSILFNKDAMVLENNVGYVREVLTFSYIVMWISFVLSIISLGILVYGIFSKKSLFSKIGSTIFVSSFIMLVLVNFDNYEIGITTKYLSVSTPFYLIALLVSIVGLFSTFTIKDK